jgi:hypothetical protein
MSDHWEAPPCTGASGIGQMDTSPDADAISILQRVRDGLSGKPAENSSDEGEAAA